MSKATVMAALKEHGPLTTAELEGILGINQPAITKSIQYLRKHHQVRIKEWLAPLGRGKCAPVYLAVVQDSYVDDAPYPKALTRKEVCRRYNERHKVAISLRRYGAKSKAVGMWAGLL